MADALTYNYAPREAFVPLHARENRWGVVIAHRRAGKRLALDTEVPMADGSWTTMGALKAGDMILDAQGRPTTVTIAHPIEENTNAYRVCFDDGSFVVADAEHLWDTRTKLDRAHTTSGMRIRQQRPATTKTTQEIAETLMYQGENNHTIDLCAPALTPEADLPIPPYIMGLWLGDGTSARFELTNMDFEPMLAWQDYADEMGFECVVIPTTSRATTLQLRQGSAAFHPNTLLRNLGLGQAGVKFIPEAYLRGSVEQRMALFAGLMDSDGTIGQKGSMEVTFKQREMIDGFHQLACSLGIKLSRPKEKLVQLPGWDEPRLYWRLSFTTEFNPFTIERHRTRWQPRHPTRNESGERFIVACEKIESVPMRCITVDSPDHLYLVTRDYIPTHNSTALINELVIRGLHARDDGLRQQFAYMCPYQNQARSVAWQVLKDYTAPFARCPGYKISEMNLTVTLPNPRDLNKPGATIMLLGAENAERLRGIFLDGVVMDEFQDIPVYVWDTIIRPALADRQGFAVFSGTVKGRNNALWELYEKAALPASGWFQMLVKASESGILPDDELADLKTNMTDEAYSAEMECNPDAIVTGRIFLQHLQRKQITKVPWQPDGGLVITAWDLGMSDTTSIWTAQPVGKEVHLLDFYEQSGQGLDHYVNWLRKLDYAKHFGSHLMPHDTNVRELGTGVSRLQTLRSMGLRNVRVVPKLPKAEQIDAARMLLPRCWFDATNCREGIKSLENYSYIYDQKRQCFNQTPLHDKWSNASDSFQVLAVGMRKALAVTDTSDLTMPRFDDDERPMVEAWQADGEIF